MSTTLLLEPTQGQCSIIEVINRSIYTYIHIHIETHQKLLKRRGRREAMKEQYRWGEFDQSTLYAFCRYHNENLLYNKCMLIKIKLKKENLKKNLNSYFPSFNSALRSSLLRIHWNRFTGRN
jgi:hypothetical protein